MGILKNCCMRNRERALTLRGGIDGSVAASVFSLLLVALLASGYFFAELPVLSAVLPAAAPVGALIPVGISAPRWAAAARVAVTVAVVVGAMRVALRWSPPWSGRNDVHASAHSVRRG